jgi:hypothetical protein
MYISNNGHVKLFTYLGKKLQRYFIPYATKAMRLGAVSFAVG